MRKAQRVSIGSDESIIAKLSEADQRRLEFLMGRNTEGQLTAEELVEFEALGEEAVRLSLENARRLAARREGRAASGPPRGSR